MSFLLVVRNILVPSLLVVTAIGTSPSIAADPPGSSVSSSGGKVCFYESTSMTGEGFCAQAGESNSYLGDWNNRIVSLRTVGYGTQVDVCTAPNFRNCTTISGSVPVLGWLLQGSISSFQVH
jgi:hypothetical protein